MWFKTRQKFVLNNEMNIENTWYWSIFLAVRIVFLEIIIENKSYIFCLCSQIALAFIFYKLLSSSVRVDQNFDDYQLSYLYIRLERSRCTVFEWRAGFEWNLLINITSTSTAFCKDEKDITHSVSFTDSIGHLPAQLPEEVCLIHRLVCYHEWV